jgi:hypothetical protein
VRGDRRESAPSIALRDPCAESGSRNERRRRREKIRTAEPAGLVGCRVDPAEGISREARTLRLDMFRARPGRGNEGWSEPASEASSITVTSRRPFARGAVQTHPSSKASTIVGGSVSPVRKCPVRASVRKRRSFRREDRARTPERPVASMKKRARRSAPPAVRTSTAHSAAHAETASDGRRSS